MKLKLSTLAIIIGIIFFGYYFIYTPQPSEQMAYVPMSTIPAEEEYGTELTSLDTPFGDYEGFEVTPLDNYLQQEIYNDPVGNVRPDNVMHVEEPVTKL
uniref:Transmembrane protein n=1 Tax=Marseillevirus LCMAC201 TaxID=2506605 RepID=A0A481YWI6_9VIRU|nr:MAG: hypothetical protein LCMAC201_00470 [Marseillevirus LCMAC201]